MDKKNTTHEELDNWLSDIKNIMKPEHVEKPPVKKERRKIPPSDRPKAVKRTALQSQNKPLIKPPSPEELRRLRRPKNPHAPKKGSRIFVEPIKTTEDVRKIAVSLKSSPRNHLLFILGINNSLRAGDLLGLKVRDVSRLHAGQTTRIKTGKGKKIRQDILVVNNTVYNSLRNFLGILKPSEDDFLFKSKKGRNQPITIQAVNNYIKKWTKAADVKGNYGAHTLRKTWGYIQYKQFSASLEDISLRFSHANVLFTRRYLGLNDTESNKTLITNEIG